MTMIDNTLDVLWGTNGNIWIQRKLNSSSTSNQNNDDDTTKDLADLQEQLRQEHANTPVLPDERQSIARLRNAIECLRLVHSLVTPEFAQEIYNKSIELSLRPYQILLADNVIRLTESFRLGN